MLKLMYNGNTVTCGGGIVSFRPKIYTLTLQNDGHGTIGATKTTGYAGDTVTLSNSYNTYYRFNNYTQTGGSLNGSTFTFGNSDATAKANFKVNYFTATGNFNFATGAAAAGVASWSRNCDGIIRARTGSLPSNWGSNDSNFNPSNASSYKINWNTTLYFQSNNIYKGSKPMTGYNRIYCGTTNVKTTTCTIDGSRTGDAAKVNTNNKGNSTIQGHPYMNAAINSTTARTQMNCNSCSPNGWTATGIAP